MEVRRGKVMEEKMGYGKRNVGEVVVIRVKWYLSVGMQSQYLI